MRLFRLLGRIWTHGFLALRSGIDRLQVFRPLGSLAFGSGIERPGSKSKRESTRAKKPPTFATHQERSPVGAANRVIDTTVAKYADLIRSKNVEDDHISDVRREPAYRFA